ncbi:MAG: helix-turn-helix transcriptional regulator [Tepidiforma sp.]
MARKRLQESLGSTTKGLPEVLGVYPFSVEASRAVPVPRPGERYGQRLKQYREERGLTQGEAERLSGVRRDYIGAVETGRIGVIYPDTFNRLRALYGFPGWEILELMGYQTDAADAHVHPAIASALKGLSPEEQEKLAPFVKAAASLVRSATTQGDAPENR